MSQERLSIHDPEVRRLYDALVGSVDYYDIYEDAHRDPIQRKAAKVPPHGRDEMNVLRCVLKGDSAELCAKWKLDQAGYDVEKNDEDVTKEYHWDLKVRGARPILIEVKSFSTLESRKYVSWKVEPHEKPDDIFGTLCMKWESYDFVLAMRVTEHFECTPWMLIDSRAFSSEAGLFVKSIEHEGQWFLQDRNAEKRQLLRRF